MKKKKLTLVVIAALLLAGVNFALAQEVVVYTARKEHLIKPLFDAYTNKTGVKIKYITDKAEMLFARLKAEGSNTPADMLITVDAGNLWHAAEKGLLATVDSETLNRNIPPNLRDPENRWFGLSLRVRTIVYNSGKISPSELSTYEALGDARWKNRLLLRTSKKVYNQSLVASLIAEHGEAKAERIVRDWVNNLAAPPFPNDTAVMKNIAAGLGDVGIVNTYYFGRLKKKNPALPLALYWPNQSGSGAHVNISGAGITTHAKHSEEALRLLEWLSSEEAQGLYADANMEYPVNSRIEPNPEVASWGEFKANPINVSVYGLLQTSAIRLMDRAGYK